MKYKAIFFDRDGTLTYFNKEKEHTIIRENHLSFRIVFDININNNLFIYNNQCIFVILIFRNVTFFLSNHIVLLYLFI